ncbi:MAG TPA: LysR family transcriptional regulator [Myxococcales bacterium]|nr:LysR family transcriptional regulator [Myxococcales bacterium]
MLEHLRYFQAVARCGSLSAAARVLQVSQPGLTAVIKQLEESFGTKLLVRLRTGVSLTSTGEELLRFANESLARLDEVEHRIKGLECEEVGSFVIGCHESLGAYFLPQWMRGFLESNPRIQLSLSNAPSRTVLEATVERSVHFGLVVNPEPHPDLVQMKLFRDAVDLFVLADGAPRAGDLEAAKERLRRGPLVFAGRIVQSQQIIDQLAAMDALPPRLLSSGDLEMVKSFALAGLGVAIIPRRVARYLQDGKLRRLHPALPFVSDEIHLLFRGDAHRTRAFVITKDAIVAHGRALDCDYEE